MPRRENNNNDLLLLQDNLSDSVLGIYYRQPTTKERQAYLNKRSIRQGNRFVDNSAACRVESGKRIITGLRDGDFERRVEGGNYRPIATNRDSADYYEAWPEWMEKHCSDVLTALAVRVFEVPVQAGAKEAAEDGTAGSEEEDLEKE